MKIHFFERKSNDATISIEKLFGIIQNKLRETIKFEVFKNPYALSLFGVIKAMIYFRRNQGTINHITGDIHWASIFLKKYKTILTIHDIVGMETLVGLKRKVYFYLWLYLPAKRVHTIVAISNKTKNDLVRLMPWAEKKILVIPNCCTIQSDFSDIKAISDFPKFLIVGTRSNKNIENMLAALKGISCELHVVGALTTLQKRELPLDTICYFNYENISDEAIRHLYKKCDILLFVSTFEGFGLPIIEAQSQDCIVVTSNIEPMLEVAGNGAVFANPIDSTSINEAILKVLNYPELQKTLIEKGRKNIDRFSVDSVAEKYVALYHKMYREQNVGHNLIHK